MVGGGVPVRALPASAGRLMSFSAPMSGGQERKRYVRADLSAVSG
jgi:hypothetical protein